MARYFYIIFLTFLSAAVLIPCIPGTTRTNLIALAEKWPLWFAWGMGIALTAAFILLNLTKNRGWFGDFLVLAIGLYSTFLAMNTMELEEISDVETRYVKDYKLSQYLKEQETLNKQYDALIAIQDKTEQTIDNQNRLSWETGAREARRRSEAVLEERKRIEEALNDIKDKINSREIFLSKHGSKLQEAGSNIFSFLAPERVIQFMNAYLSLLNDILIYVALRVLTRLYPGILINFSGKNDRNTLAGFLKSVQGDGKATVTNYNSSSQRRNAVTKVTRSRRNGGDEFKKIAARVKRGAVKRALLAHPGASDEFMCKIISDELLTEMPRTTFNYWKVKLIKAGEIKVTNKGTLWT